MVQLQGKCGSTCTVKRRKGKCLRGLIFHFWYDHNLLVCKNSEVALEALGDAYQK